MLGISEFILRQTSHKNECLVFIHPVLLCLDTLAYYWTFDSFDQQMSDCFIDPCICADL